MLHVCRMLCACLSKTTITAAINKLAAQLRLAYFTTAKAAAAVKHSTDEHILHSCDFVMTRACVGAQGTSPIYNLLPDMLSSMSQDAGLSEESFQAIVMHLLTFIGKAKHVDSLVGQLCLRFSTTQVGIVIILVKVFYRMYA